VILPVQHCDTQEQAKEDVRLAFAICTHYVGFGRHPGRKTSGIDILQAI
jgi:hypothetical protein